jgi:hypothetical protein
MTRALTMPTIRGRNAPAKVFGGAFVGKVPVFVGEMSVR